MANFVFVPVPLPNYNKFDTFGPESKQTFSS